MLLVFITDSEQPFTNWQDKPIRENFDPPWYVQNIYLTFKFQHHKIVKHTQTIRWLLPTNCLSVFEHFVGLGLKRSNNRISG